MSLIFEKLGKLFYTYRNQRTCLNSSQKDTIKLKLKKNLMMKNSHCDEKR